MEEQRGGTGSLHMFICVYLLVVWILSSQEGKRNVFKEKRERDPASTERFELGIVGWFPAQSACGFQSPWHVISPQSTSSNPPSCLSLSHHAVNLNTIVFSDNHQQRRKKMGILQKSVYRYPTLSFFLMQLEWICFFYHMKLDRL